MLAGAFTWAPPPAATPEQQPPVRTESPEPARPEPRRVAFTPQPIVRTYAKPRQATAKEQGRHGPPSADAMQLGDGQQLMRPPALPRRTPSGNDPGAARAAVTMRAVKPKQSDKLKLCPTRRLQKLLH